MLKLWDLKLKNFFPNFSGTEYDAVQDFPRLRALISIDSILDKMGIPLTEMRVKAKIDSSTQSYIKNSVFLMCLSVMNQKFIQEQNLEYQQKIHDLREEYLEYLEQRHFSLSNAAMICLNTEQQEQTKTTEVNVDYFNQSAIYVYSQAERAFWMECCSSSRAQEIVGLMEEAHNLMTENMHYYDNRRVELEALRDAGAISVDDYRRQVKDCEDYNTHLRHNNIEGFREKAWKRNEQFGALTRADEVRDLRAREAELQAAKVQADRFVSLAEREGSLTDTELSELEQFRDEHGDVHEHQQVCAAPLDLMNEFDEMAVQHQRQNVLRENLYTDKRLNPKKYEYQLIDDENVLVDTTVVRKRADESYEKFQSNKWALFQERESTNGQYEIDQIESALNNLVEKLRGVDVDTAKNQDSPEQLLSEDIQEALKPFYMNMLAEAESSEKLDNYQRLSTDLVDKFDRGVEEVASLPPEIEAFARDRLARLNEKVAGHTEEVKVEKQQQQEPQFAEVVEREQPEAQKVEHAAIVSDSVSPPLSTKNEIVSPQQKASLKKVVISGIESLANNLPDNNESDLFYDLSDLFRDLCDADTLSEQEQAKAKIVDFFNTADWVGEIEDQETLDELSNLMLSEDTGLFEEAELVRPTISGPSLS